MPERDSTNNRCGWVACPYNNNYEDDGYEPYSEPRCLAQKMCEAGKNPLTALIKFRKERGNGE